MTFAKGSIEDWIETQDKGVMTEFEVQTRLHFGVMGNPDGTSTIVATSVFKVTTHDMYEGHYDQDRFANKIFSTWEFNIKEERQILDKIQAIITRTVSKN